MSRINLTLDQLIAEYIDWVKVNGDGRSAGSLRFGQCMWNAHGHRGQSFPEFFYAEKAHIALEIAIKEIANG